MNKTSIDYLTHTWNPIVMRCTKVSPACDNCWHLARARMLSRNPLIPVAHRQIYAGNTPPRINPLSINNPLKRKKPAVIGVQFMGDLFHDDVSFYLVEEVFNVINSCDPENGGPDHKFLILTKRPKRMKAFFEMNEWRIALNPKIWLGVTIESQREDKRILTLKDIPAAKKFVSFEPLLGPFDFLPPMLRWIDWAIVGGESGSKARPMHPDWPRALRDQCQAAGVPFFFKQWGEFMTAETLDADDYPDRDFDIIDPDGRGYWRVGKKKAGRILDGREWNEYPRRDEK